MLGFASVHLLEWLLASSLLLIGALIVMDLIGVARTIISAI